MLFREGEKRGDSVLHWRARSEEGRANAFAVAVQKRRKGGCIAVSASEEVSSREGFWASFRFEAEKKKKGPSLHDEHPPSNALA